MDGETISKESNYARDQDDIIEVRESKVNIQNTIFNLFRSKKQSISTNSKMTMEISM